MPSRAEDPRHPAAAYIEAQFTLLVAAREAADDGLALTEMDTSWLSTPPEEAGIEARVEIYQEGDREELAGGGLAKIMDALRGADYEPLAGLMLRQAPS